MQNDVNILAYMLRLESGKQRIPEGLLSARGFEDEVEFRTVLVEFDLVSVFYRFKAGKAKTRVISSLCI